MLANVCKHFILFTLEVDASEREPITVKLYAEKFCKMITFFFEEPVLHKRKSVAFCRENWLSPQREYKN